MIVIDLSQKIVSGMRVYPGDPEVEITRFLEHEKNYCHVDGLHMGTHTGTHIDAPYHFISQGKKINDFPLESFVGRGVIIDVTKKGECEPITVEDIIGYVESLKQNDFALFQSGWDTYFQDEKYVKHPYLTKECAELIVNCGIKLVGVDFLNVDSTVTEQFDAHDVLLSKEIFIVENLTNLQAVKDMQGTKDQLKIIENFQDVNLEQRGWFHFVPLNIMDADGSPIRAYYIEL